jgi:hypothetical protein
MWPREGARQATELGEATEEWARRRRSGGGRGGSDSGERVTPFDQHVARGGVVVHREGLRLTGARGKRLGHGAHRAAAMADGGGSGGNARAREERPGRVYGRWRSVRRSWSQPRRRCTRGVGSKALRSLQGFPPIATNPLGNTTISVAIGGTIAPKRWFGCNLCVYCHTKFELHYLFVRLQHVDANAPFFRISVAFGWK